MSFRQRVNKIFGKTIFKEPEVSPTYRPDLVHGLEVLKDAINEKSPGRNLAPLVALIKAYGTKTPSTAQLKTIHYGTSIFNYIINQCGPYTVGFQEDEIERISQVANKAGEYFEIKYGRPCPKAVEAARRLAGTHPDSKKPFLPTPIILISWLPSSAMAHIRSNTRPAPSRNSGRRQRL